jgi:phage terminase large subunit
MLSIRPTSRGSHWSSCYSWTLPRAVRSIAIPFPYLITKRWVYDQHLAWWHGSDSSSPNWLSRVLARFPDQAQNALIKMIWLEQAKQRALQDPVGDPGSGPLVAGVDVGGGEAETVVYVCECKHNLRKIIAMGAWRGEDTRGQVVSFLNQFRSRLSVVRVDSIGVGHNFGLHLRDFRFTVEPINVGMPCESKPNLRENDPARRFVNLKASFYQTLADAFERGQVQGLTDEATIGQLAGLLYEIDSQGRMKIESKERARERGVSSPDRAEALMLALGDAVPVKYEFIRVPPPPNSISGSFLNDRYPGRKLTVQEQDRLDDMQADLRRMQRRLSLPNSRGFRKGYGW